MVVVLNFAKFQSPRTVPSGRKVTPKKEKHETRKEKTLIVATRFCLQRPRAVHKQTFIVQAYEAHTSQIS
jgi:hypothetical protein